MGLPAFLQAKFRSTSLSHQANRIRKKIPFDCPQQKDTKPSTTQCSGDVATVAIGKIQSPSCQEKGIQRQPYRVNLLSVWRYYFNNSKERSAWAPAWHCRPNASERRAVCQRITARLLRTWSGQSRRIAERRGSVLQRNAGFRHARPNISHHH